jgi:type II secretory pathway pseudopilin PulG
MELLVVLLIIGILSTVALRTIDATRDRSLFDQTSKEMNQLVQAMVGNPDLTYDGRRVDFGYYGDMETLPGTLRDLVYSTGSPAWHGPYLKLTSAGDTASYRFDGWGHQYIYMPELGTITSDGNVKFPMTVKVTDDLSQLSNNEIAGTITDIKGAAPGTQNLGLLSVKLYYNNPDAFGGASPVVVVPDAGGYYEFSPHPPTPTLPAKVPIGTLKLVAATASESLVRYVTVLPRSKTIVDFKFSSSFWDKLRMVGAPTIDGNGNGFLIKIINDQATDVTINSLRFLQTPDSAFMRDFHIGGVYGLGYPIPNGQRGTGPGDTVGFAPVTIAPNGTQEVELAFQDFFKTEMWPPGDTFHVHDSTFEFRFSDGSEITVKP